MDQQPQTPPHEHLSTMLKGRGLYSRKLWFGVGCVVALAAMVFVAAHYAAVAGIYSEFVGGVVGVYSIYAGANAATKWGSAKHIGSKLADNEGDSSDDSKSTDDKGDDTK